MVASDPPASRTAVVVYYGRDLWIAPEVVRLDVTAAEAPRAALEALVARDPAAPGLARLAPDGARVLDVGIDGNVLVADLSGLRPPQGLGAVAEGLLVQSIVHTGAQFPGVRAVRILVDGEAIESVAGHVVIPGPLEPDPQQLAPVTLDSAA